MSWLKTTIKRLRGDAKVEAELAPLRAEIEELRRQQEGLSQRVQRLARSLAARKRLQRRTAEAGRRTPTIDSGARPQEVPGAFRLLGAERKAWPITGDNPHVAVVASLPKAGTYLIPELLRPLGLEHVPIHLGLDTHRDYRFATREQADRDDGRFVVRIPLEQLVELLQPGQVIGGHLRFDERTMSAVAGCKVVAACRDLRDGIVSHMRWLARTGRGGKKTAPWRNMPDGPDKMLAYLDAWGSFYVDLCRQVAGWLDQDQALALRFETLMGDDGADAQAELMVRLADWVDRPIDPDEARGILTGAIGAATLTYSGRRTQREAFWDDRVEEAFQAQGGEALNGRLGYEP